MLRSHANKAYLNLNLNLERERPSERARERDFFFDFEKILYYNSLHKTTFPNNLTSTFQYHKTKINKESNNFTHVPFNSCSY